MSKYKAAIKSFYKHHNIEIQFFASTFLSIALPIAFKANLKSIAKLYSINIAFSLINLVIANYLYNTFTVPKPRNLNVSQADDLPLKYVYGRTKKEISRDQRIVKFYYNVFDVLSDNFKTLLISIGRSNYLPPMNEIQDAHNWYLTLLELKNKFKFLENLQEKTIKKIDRKTFGNDVQFWQKTARRINIAEFISKNYFGLNQNTFSYILKLFSADKENPLSFNSYSLIKYNDSIKHMSYLNWFGCAAALSFHSLLLKDSAQKFSFSFLNQFNWFNLPVENALFSPSSIIFHGLIGTTLNTFNSSPLVNKILRNTLTNCISTVASYLKNSYESPGFSMVIRI